LEAQAMNESLRQVRQRRKELLAQLAVIEQMRRGSLVPQMFEAVRKDGTKVRRGPYTLYTSKEKGKTVSRRITDPEQVLRYREQIQAFRRFEMLANELVRAGEKISDLVLSDEAELKKKRSRRRKE
jgi:hypothetical protein